MYICKAVRMYVGFFLIIHYHINLKNWRREFSLEYGSSSKFPAFGFISFCPRRDNSVRLKIDKRHVPLLKVLVVPEHSCLTKIKDGKCGKKI